MAFNRRQVPANMMMFGVDNAGRWQPIKVKGSGELEMEPLDDLAEYETVAASQTGQVLGASGALGDCLRGLLIVPAAVGAGTVSIKDGAGAAINVFVTGLLSDLKPHWIPLGIKSVSGAWSVTTGASVSVIAVGSFT